MDSLTIMGAAAGAVHGAEAIADGQSEEIQ